MIPELLTTTLVEATTGLYVFRLEDEKGTGNVGPLTTLTVTLYDVDSQQVVNARLHQDILNTNGGSVVTDPGPPLTTTVTFALEPEDTVIFNDNRQVEYRVLEFVWSWDSGQRVHAHAVQFGIENLAFVP